jgi:hypothetical protein
MTPEELVLQIRRRVIDNRCASKDASVRVSVVESIVTEAKEKVEQLRKQGAVNQLRLLQLEARADILQEKISAYAT